MSCHECKTLKCAQLRVDLKILQSDIATCWNMNVTTIDTEG